MGDSASSLLQKSLEESNNDWIAEKGCEPMLKVKKCKRMIMLLVFSLVFTLPAPFDAGADAAALFSSGLENGETQTTWIDAIETSQNVTGYISGIQPECSKRTGETAHTGTSALMFSGTDGSASTSYCYYKVFDVNLPVTAATKLSYWFYPQTALARFVAVDFVCTDGSTLRDSGARDAGGISMHPGAGRGTVNAWSLVESNVGQWLSGKTIDRILVGYDQGPSTGQYRGFIDDIFITDGTAGSGTPNPKIVSPVYPTGDIVIADYDVTDYGADRTGTNDSTAAIQNAVNDCYSSGGGTVWMPAGTYKVTGTIEVKAFVTLRGDWKDADTGGGDYGTIVKAQLASGANGPVLFKIGGSAGVVGITTYYPVQSITNPLAYNYTFLIPGRAWAGEQNYMAASIMNCTLLNSYKGIGISTSPSDHGGNVADGQVHETATLRNVKGTVLNQGAVAYNGADVGTWEHVVFNNSYWANAGSTYNAPGQAALNSYTRANATAYVFGDLEWEHFYDIRCSDFNVGINIVAGQRAQFVGEFYGAVIQNTNTAVKVDAVDTRWDYPIAFARSVLSGSSSAVVNNTAKKIQFTDCTLSGAYDGTKATVQNPGTSPASYPERTSVPKVSRAVLYDVSKAPYNAPGTSSTGTALPSGDATSAIQKALNDAGAAGGGVVYLPAGWYRINTRLTVPANVELRGCASVPSRDQTGRSAGTVLFAYEGAGTSTPDTAAAFITVNAGTQRAGVSGLRVFYPNNNPKNGAVVKYPYSIRGSGSNVYIVNVGLPNTYNGIDLASSRCDGHYVRKVLACAFAKGVTVGQSSEGWVEAVLTNPNMCCRVGYGIPGWIVNDTAAGSGYGGDGGAQLGSVINYTRANEKFLNVSGSSGERFLNCFAYGPNTGLAVTAGTVTMCNFGTDNVGSYGVNVSSGTVRVCNYARYNGTASTGTVTIYNPMILTP